MIPGIIAQRRHSSAPPSRLWTPLDMTVVPQIYLDAHESVITEVSGACSAISNLGTIGAGGDFSQSDSTKRPIVVENGIGSQRVLRFDGSSDVLTADSLAAREIFKNKTASWAFFVYKKRNADASGQVRYMLYVPERFGAIRFGVLVNAETATNNKVGMYGRRLDADTPSLLYSPDTQGVSFRLLGAYVNYTSRLGQIRENGVQTASNVTFTTSGSTSDTTASTPILLGGTSSGNIWASDVDLAAVVIGNSMPSALEMQKLEGCYAHRLGLTASLPSGHPYKSAAPTV